MAWNDTYDQQYQALQAQLAAGAPASVIHPQMQAVVAAREAEGSRIAAENDTWNSLAEYLSEYANEFFDGTNVRCRLEMPMDLPAHPLPSEVRHSLFLVIKEALNNTLKHAHPTEVRIGVSQSDSLIEITITDDGQGFEPGRAGAGSSSSGLRNMRERVESLHGRFQVESGPGKGTRLTIGIRLDANPKAPVHA